MARARQLARNGLAEASRSVQGLRPQLLEQVDLPTALNWLCQHLSIPGQSRIACQLYGTPYVLPPKIADTLFRVAQEALANACKHANASQIQLRLSFESHQIQLRVQDNGRGFDCHRSLFRTGGGGGMGMLSMQERATEIGGWLRHTSLETCESSRELGDASNSQPKQGTAVILTIPIPYPNTSHRQSVL